MSEFMGIQGVSVDQIFDESTSAEILNKLGNIEDPRWIRRDELESRRGVGDSGCAYDYCNQLQMTKELKEYIAGLAPKYPGMDLERFAVNRYRVGDFIGPHKDQHMYIKNLVVALQENGDGLFIDEHDIFVPDKVGQGVAFEGIGPVHSVPEVKNLRFVLIYLYQ